MTRHDPFALVKRDHDHGDVTDDIATLVPSIRSLSREHIEGLISMLRYRADTMPAPRATPPLVVDATAMGLQ